ncbi:Acyl-CoA dehydrogenase OS=Streptomyces fumanus OX=67302 GN=GCM10018772_48480 PE=3 SV=1 [Streptomyces fumanus]
MAKLHCTDTACGSPPTPCRSSAATAHTADFPAERYMREAKVLQIVRGHVNGYRAHG